METYILGFTFCCGVDLGKLHFWLGFNWSFSVSCGRSCGTLVSSTTLILRHLFFFDPNIGCVHLNTPPTQASLNRTTHTSSSSKYSISIVRFRIAGILHRISHKKSMGCWISELFLGHVLFEFATPFYHPFFQTKISKFLDVRPGLKNDYCNYNNIIKTDQSALLFWTGLIRGGHFIVL